MKRTHFSFFLLVVLLLSMITACTKRNWEEINEMEYNTSIGIPLGKIEASVVNLLAQVDDSLLVTNPESGNCYLYWKQEDQRIDFNIANFTVGGSLKENILISDHLNTSITSNITIPKGEKVRFIVNYDYDFVFNETGEESVTRVDSMLVASSELNCQYKLTDINIGYTMPLKMIITFPGIDDLNGYTIERLISVVNGQFNETVSNYLVYFGNNQTLTPIEIAFEVISDGTLTLSPSSSIELTSQFRLINARVAWGYFFHQGPVSRDNISKELPNEIFDNPHITNNQLLFSNPQINFNIISNIGMPLFFEFSNVYAVGKNNRSEERRVGKEC